MKRSHKELLNTKLTDIKRAADSTLPLDTKSGILAEVVNAVPLGAASLYRWEYDIKAAQISATSPYNTSPKSGVPTMKALSISELGNDANVFSYGVPAAQIPAGFAPVKIPNGTPVWCVPWRKDDGSFVWLIINTQAITGVC